MTVARINHDLIRERCRKARLLNKYTPDSAAQKMGYKNTSMISKMECKSSNTGINWDYLIRASKAFGVSMDYLCGLSDYPERDPKSVEQLAAYNSVKYLFEKEMKKMALSLFENIPKHNSLGYLSMMIDDLTENHKMIKYIREINPNFDEDIRGGAKYIKFLDEVQERVSRARWFLDRNSVDETIIKEVKSIVSEEQLELDIKEE